jgi:hypothetical protein
MSGVTKCPFRFVRNGFAKNDPIGFAISIRSPAAYNTACSTTEGIFLNFQLPFEAEARLNKM